MTISKSISVVKSELSSPAHAATFAAGRARHDALSAFDSTAALLRTIERERARHYDHSEKLVRALLVEYRRERHAVWVGLLLVLCKPMLVSIRTSIAGDAIPADDLDQLVMASFLESLGKVPLDESGAQTFARLRTETRRAVLRTVRRAQTEGARFTTVDPDALQAIVDGVVDEACTIEVEAEVEPGSVEFEVDDAELQREALESMGEGLLSPDVLDMVAATTIYGRRLVEYVDAKHPELGESERRRVYGREKRRHARAIALLRKALAPLRGRRWCGVPAEDAPPGEQADTEDGSQMNGDASELDHTA